MGCREQSIGSFMQAVDKADLVLIVARNDYYYQVDKKLKMPERMHRSQSHRENFKSFRKISCRFDIVPKVYRDDSPFVKEYQENYNEFLNSIVVKKLYSEVDGEIPYLTFKPNARFSFQTLFNEAEIVYSKYNDLPNYVEVNNNIIGNRRKLRNIVYGDTLILALKRLDEPITHKGKYMTYIENPGRRNQIYIPFEDCTSYVEIHGDMCYGQFDHPYSLTEPEKYPYRQEVYPVKDVIDKIKRITGK